MCISAPPGRIAKVWCPSLKANVANLVPFWERYDIKSAVLIVTLLLRAEGAARKQLGC